MKLTITFVKGGTVNGNNGKGRKSDEFELHPP